MSSGVVFLQSNTGTKHEFNVDYIPYWPRINSLSQLVSDGDNVIDVLDIEDKYIVKIIEFLQMFSVPTNYFGIHCPLRNKRLGLSRNPDLVIPEDECKPCLIESGVPKMFVDYLESFEVKDGANDIVNFYLIVFNENIKMLYTLMGAYIAYSVTNINYEEMVFYQCEVNNINPLIHFTEQSRDHKASVRKFVIDKIGKREFIYDTNFVPFNLEEELKLTKDITYIRFKEVVPDYSAMYIAENPPIVPLTPAQISERRFLDIPNSEHIPGFNTLTYLTENYVSKKPTYNGPVLSKLNFQKESAEEMKSISDIIKPFIEDKFFGTVEDDDARSYTEYTEEGKDETTFNQDLYEDFLRRQKTRFHVREFLINNRKNNRQLRYKFMVEKIKRRDRSVQNTREFKIGLAFKNKDIVKVFEDPDAPTPAGAAEGTVVGAGIGAGGAALAPAAAATDDDNDYDTSASDTEWDTSSDYTESSSESEDDDDDEDEDEDKPKKAKKVHRPHPKPRNVVKRNVPGNPFKYKINKSYEGIFKFIGPDIYDTAEDGYAERSIYAVLNPNDLYMGDKSKDVVMDVGVEESKE